MMYRLNVLGVLLLVLLVACASGETGSSEGTTEGKSKSPSQRASKSVGSSSSSVPETGTGQAFPPPIDGPTTGKKEFRSPSGNVMCLITEGLGVSCSIRDHVYPLPARDEDCQLDWQPIFGVGRDAPATFGSCAGDVLVITEVVLPYGTTSVVGRHACMSRTTGMVCWDTRTKHGFRAAKATFELH
jgi:hypothetical protein